jgi:large subunit ribosomal protein L21
VEEGASCTLHPLLYVDGEQVLDSSQDGPAVRVEARVVAHERGPKLRVVKFKPKRGYKRRTGHRQELTRIEITAIEAGGRPRRTRAKEDAGEASGRSAGAGAERKQADPAASQRGRASRARGGKASGGGQPARGRSASEGEPARGRGASARAETERKEESDGS